MKIGEFEILKKYAETRISIILKMIIGGIKPSFESE
jgi:hypothetical protein